MSTPPKIQPDSDSGRQRARIHPENFLPSILRNLTEGISNRIAKCYAEDFNLTVTEWRILLQLSAHHSLTASQIVDITAMEKSKISRALSSMEAEGIVQRQVDSEDNRRQLLALTDYGYDMYAQIAPRVLDWEKQLLEGLDISEYRDLVFLLNKLSRRMKAME